MRYLRLPGREELHAWTEALASRGDMVEVGQPEKEWEDIPLPFDAVSEIPPLFTMKSVGYGRYQIHDRLGNDMLTKAVQKAEAELKLAELNA